MARLAIYAVTSNPMKIYHWGLLYYVHVYHVYVYNVYVYHICISVYYVCQYVYFGD